MLCFPTASLILSSLKEQDLRYHCLKLCISWRKLQINKPYLLSIPPSPQSPTCYFSSWTLHFTLEYTALHPHPHLANSCPPSLYTVKSRKSHFIPSYIAVVPKCAHSSLDTSSIKALVPPL